MHHLLIEKSPKNQDTNEPTVQGAFGLNPLNQLLKKSSKVHKISFYFSFQYQVFFFLQRNF